MENLKPDAIELADMKRQSWDELDRTNKLTLLKDRHPNVYREKFRTRFGFDFDLPKETLNAVELSDLQCQTWDELDKANKLVLLKDKNPELDSLFSSSDSTAMATSL